MMKNILFIFLLFITAAATAQNPAWAPTIKTPMKYNRIHAENLFIGDTLPGLTSADSNRVAINGGNVFNTYYDSTCACYQWRQSGTVVKPLGDSAVVVGKDTIWLNSDLYFDLDPDYLMQVGRNANIGVRQFSVDSLLWNIYSTRQSKSTNLDSIRGLIGRFDNGLIAPPDTTTVKNGIANISGELWIGDGIRYANVTGSSSITAGLRLLGTGASGDPLRLDTLSLSSAYLKNQYSAKESKVAWLDSIHLTRLRTSQIFAPGFLFNTAADDALMHISRSMSAGSGNGHLIQDFTVISRSGNPAYASFDTRAKFTGQPNFDHNASLQSMPEIDLGTTLGVHYGGVDQPTVNGVLNIRYGYKINNAGGSGTIGSNIGLQIDDQTKGTIRKSIVANGGPMELFSRNTNATETLIKIMKNSFNPAAIMWIDFQMSSSLLAGQIGARGNTISTADLVFNADSTRLLELLGTGFVKTPTYGSGTKTGTAAYDLSVDASGNHIESSISRYISNQTASKEARSFWARSGRADSMRADLGFVSNSAIRLDYNSSRIGIYGFRNTGTYTSPAPPVTGSSLIFVGAGRWDGVKFDSIRAGGFTVNATENWSGTANGAEILFRVVPNGQLAEAITLRGFENRAIGVSASGSTLQTTTGDAALFVHKSFGVTNATTAFLLNDSAGNRIFTARDDKHVGVRTASPNSILHVQGSFATAIRTITSTTTLDSIDYTVLINATSGAVAINLPTAVGIAGRIYVLKKVDNSGNAGTATPAGSETIDNSATYALTTENKYVTIQSNGTNWVIIGNN